MNETTKQTESIVWKEGDWCYCEYKLQLVKRVKDDGRVNEVSDGNSSHDGSDLRDRMFPMDLRSKLISEEFSRVFDKLHKKGNGHRLNFPDIHRWFVSKWVDVMEFRACDDTVKHSYRDLNTFYEGVMKQVTRSCDKSVDGCRVFR